MTERPWNVALRSQGETLEIAVYDVIGQDFWGEGFTSKDFLAKLRAAPKATKIQLRINSIGGIVDDAKAMINLLAERAAAGVTVEAFVDGLAASSAAFLLTAASRVVMPSNTFLMIHEVRGGARGTAADLEAGAALYRRTNEQLAEAFAAASERRGKKKTKADYLAAFAEGDLYLDADEAIEWGLADEKLEALKIAACLADLSSIGEKYLGAAPEALRSAPYVVTNQAELLKPAPEPKTPPSPVARPENQPPNGEEKKPMSQAATMNIVAIATLLGLSAEAAAAADESTITNEIKKLKASAKVGADIESLVGVTGPAALGAVRALKTTNEANAELGDKVAQLQVVNARRDFEATRDQGLKDRKLTPAVAKLYTERFESCLKDESLDADARAERAEAVGQDLKGFLAVAPRVVNVNATPPASGSGTGVMQHNGKAFEAMSGIERKMLKDENPELYASMREEALERKAV